LHTPSDTLAAFEEGAAHAPGFELVRAGEARKTGSDNYYLRFAHGSSHRYYARSKHRKSA
jgi:hypothetical protein